MDLSRVASWCCCNLRKQHFFVLQKRHFEQRIISKHMTGPTKLDFFLSVTSMTRDLALSWRKIGRLVFKFLQIWTSNSHNFHNWQPILDCNISKFKGELQRQNKLISFERAFRILQNETRIIKIGQAVLEIFNFKDRDLDNFTRKNDRKT